MQTVTVNSVTLELPVINEGSRPVRLYGFFVSKTHPTPTVLQSENQSNGKISGTTFPANLRSETINQLTPNTRYYARAYAAMDELGEDIVYSETIQFTTGQVPVAPNFSDPQVWQVRPTNLEIRYDLHNAGNSPLTEAGVVYSTSRIPQSITDGTKVRFTSPAQVGRLRHTLTSLSPSTVYYIRGYVTSAAGTVLSSGSRTVRTHQNVANASIFYQAF